MYKRSLKPGFCRNGNFQIDSLLAGSNPERLKTTNSVHFFFRKSSFFSVFMTFFRKLPLQEISFVQKVSKRKQLRENWVNSEKIWKEIPFGKIVVPGERKIRESRENFMDFVTHFGVFRSTPIHIGIVE